VNAGELTLKNIAAPVQAWRWGGSSARIADADAPVEGAKDAPSIAVLPFANMSGDPEQDYFSDGISEDIITDLSKVSGLIVIARNSSFAYKGKAPDIRAVGRELGPAGLGPSGGQSGAHHGAVDRRENRGASMGRPL
jgi:adenylate cyclase